MTYILPLKSTLLIIFLIHVNKTSNIRRRSNTSLDKTLFNELTKRNFVYKI